MTSRRETIKSRKRVCRKLDTTPIEIPASRKTIPSTRDMVKHYVRQAVQDAGGNPDSRTLTEMIDEELDLDVEDEPEWSSAYEIQEMTPVEPPHREAAPEQGAETINPEESPPNPPLDQPAPQEPSP